MNFKQWLYKTFCKVDNLQFLSWFENRCKNDMSQEEWDVLKSNIQEYFI